MAFIGSKPKDEQMDATQPRRPPARPLYTQEERARRDASVWTLVQGVLAPVQFLVFLVSVALVLASTAAAM